MVWIDCKEVGISMKKYIHRGNAENKIILAVEPQNDLMLASFGANTACLLH
jgi:hypothetical protein